MRLLVLMLNLIFSVFACVTTEEFEQNAFPQRFSAQQNLCVAARWAKRCFVAVVSRDGPRFELSVMEPAMLSEVLVLVSDRVNHLQVLKSVGMKDRPPINPELVMESMRSVYESGGFKESKEFLLTSPEGQSFKAIYASRGLVGQMPCVVPKHQTIVFPQGVSQPVFPQIEVETTDVSCD